MKPNPIPITPLPLPDRMRSLLVDLLSDILPIHRFPRPIRFLWCFGFLWMALWDYYELNGITRTYRISLKTAIDVAATIA